MKPTWMELFRPLQMHIDYLLLRLEDNDETVCPDKDSVFRCFSFFDVLDTKVVIVGQDPYHSAGTATGLAFQSNHNKPPPSLVNIFKAVRNTYPDAECNIDSWAEQGVLLFNRALTVSLNQPNSHTKVWKPITNQMIQLLADNSQSHDHKLVFMLWGNNAKEVAPLIDHNFHVVLTHTHPSPLSRKPFDKCDHFAICNETHAIRW